MIPIQGWCSEVIIMGSYRSYPISIRSEHIDDSRAKVPLACIEENNFFPKTFGSITEKVYLCMQSLIIRRLNMNIEEKKSRFYASFQGFEGAKG